MYLCRRLLVTGKNAETYHVGDVVFAEVESKAEGDQYDPEKITVNKIEIREPFNK